MNDYGVEAKMDREPNEQLSCIFCPNGQEQSHWHKYKETTSR